MVKQNILVTGGGGSVGAWWIRAKETTQHYPPGQGLWCGGRRLHLLRLGVDLGVQGLGPDLAGRPP